MGPNISSVWGDLPMNTAIISSLLAGFGTTIGAAVVLFWGRTMQRELAFFLGCAGGIMLGIVFLDLIPSALQQGNYLSTAVGVLSGIALLRALDAALGVFFPQGSMMEENFLRMGYLIAIGIALHDLPEGFAIAAGYAVPGQLGLAIALAIGLHNLPEVWPLPCPSHGRCFPMVHHRCHPAGKPLYTPRHPDRPFPHQLLPGLYWPSSGHGRRGYAVSGRR